MVLPGLRGRDQLDLPAAPRPLGAALDASQEAGDGKTLAEIVVEQLVRTGRFEAQRERLITGKKAS